MYDNEIFRRETEKEVEEQERLEELNRRRNDLHWENDSDFD